MTDRELTPEQARLREMAEEAKERLAAPGRTALARIAERNRARRERGDIVS